VTYGNLYSLYTYSAIGLSLWRASLRALISMNSRRYRHGNPVFLSFLKRRSLLSFNQRVMVGDFVITSGDMWVGLTQ
jgi:hypothetical protein